MQKETHRASPSPTEMERCGWLNEEEKKMDEKTRASYI
jgi:hypothetical protein